MKRRNTLGILLILIGIVWIVRQTGVISINWAASLKTLWPVILVAAGLSIVLGNRKGLTTGIWILTLAALIGFGIWKRNEPVKILEFDIDIGSLAEVRKEASDSEILLQQGTEGGKLILQIESAKVNLSGGSDERLVKLDSNIPGLMQRVSHGKITTLEYSHEEYRKNLKPNFRLEMNPDLRWDIEANLELVDGEFDLTEVPTERMAISIEVGDLDIRLGDKQENTELTIWGGMAGLDIYIPRDAGLKINQGKLVTQIGFHNMNIDEQDGQFVTENYDTAEQKIQIEIGSALSKIEIFGE